jgi:pyruvate/2-oxoglutarate dehydrogenase complex dihydrolipoamide acyltransferase (E2) component
MKFSFLIAALALTSVDA